MLGFIRALMRDDRGATAVEYGLIIALIVVVMSTGLVLFANAAIGMWTNVATAVANAG